jgi:hypothetical protein
MYRADLLLEREGVLVMTENMHICEGPGIDLLSIMPKYTFIFRALFTPQLSIFGQMS